jgi:hypothetical protein
MRKILALRLLQHLFILLPPWPKKIPKPKTIVKQVMKTENRIRGQTLPNFNTYYMQGLMVHACKPSTQVFTEGG